MGTCPLNFLSVGAVVVGQHLAQNSDARLAGAGKVMFARCDRAFTRAPSLFRPGRRIKTCSQACRDLANALGGPKFTPPSTSRLHHARARGNASKRKAYSLTSACSPSMRAGFDGVNRPAPGAKSIEPGWLLDLDARAAFAQLERGTLPPKLRPQSRAGSRPFGNDHSSQTSLPLSISPLTF
jgi:hypothetical protein